jgi:hypothetical protein
MIVEKLFQTALIDPVIERGARELWIISGYATPAMVYYHLEELSKRKFFEKIQIRLIVGMPSRDGISQITHSGFIDLLSNSFECRYVYRGTPVHAKSYLWVDTKESYIGSANYTQSGFNSSYREILTPVDPKFVSQYYCKVLKDSLPCNSPDLHGKIKIHGGDSSNDGSMLKSKKVFNPGSFDTKGLEKASISLVDKKGNVPGRSGLNWGQRVGRDHNQAYLALRVTECRQGFFPVQGHHITLLTDDGFILNANIAQQNSKAIHTTDNALLGRYFRRRLGLSSGERVTKDALAAYGRFSVDIYKFDDESYFLDFSKKKLQ